MTSERTHKVVYLDQKCWINIARLYFGKASRQDGNLVTKLLEASERGRMIFPLSLPHLVETNRISDDEHRNQLAFLMAKMSRGYTYQPYFFRLLRAEIRNAIFAKLGLHVMNIREYVLKQGISNLLGARATLVPREGASPSELPEEVKTRLRDILESPETMEFALRQRPPESFRCAHQQNMKDLIEKLERIRSDLSRIKDNNLRQRVFFAKNVIELVLPELAKAIYEFNLPKDFFLKKEPTGKGISELLDSLPSVQCILALTFHRDQQFQRPIEANDFNDIWFLTLAIPYSDIVVTEKMWASISKRAKLDKKCDTIILSSIDQLGKHM